MYSDSKMPSTNGKPVYFIKKTPKPDKSIYIKDLNSNSSQFGS